ncbi:TetR/AcrR family transcriptional regulator [Ruania halotolerans]|uniref:TetR/AcrR family transcriptional regulator n=1 Tax=Ruania halotolerans TaxID=2897773 RepID=UPI001E4514FE|nr:TetR family transcriptional regulator [Ruania halotolerans]UFU07412.1 TetR family transcriptional regulator [Ruania halotolerans]
MVDQTSNETPQPGSTPERIRAAAVRRFGVDGFGVGLREIASDAGVSAALVIRHYGSKDGLRRACDEHVRAVVHEAKSASVAAGDTRTLLEQFAHMEQYAPILGYILTSLIDGGPLARDLVEHMISDAVEYLAEGERTGMIRPSRDPEARARYLTYSGLGAMLLQIQLGRERQVDPGAMMREFMASSMLPTLEVYTHGLFTDSRVLDAISAQQGQPAAPVPHDVATDPPQDARR